MLDRILGSWKTTAIGAGGTALAWGAFSSLGCQVPTNGWLAWAATLVPLVIGAFAHDSKA